MIILKGHQIIGELRLEEGIHRDTLKLKGHQIIGELRHIDSLEEKYSWN